MGNRALAITILGSVAIVAIAAIVIFGPTSSNNAATISAIVGFVTVIVGQALTAAGAQDAKNAAEQTEKAVKNGNGGK